MYDRNFNPNFFTDITKPARILISGNVSQVLKNQKLLIYSQYITSPVIFGFLSVYLLLKTFFHDLDNPISYDFPWTL
jgi:hypothetical protein